MRRGLTLPMVPSGNALVSLAWCWYATPRKRYADHRADPERLITATRGANRPNGARGPEDWEPLNTGLAPYGHETTVLEPVVRPDRATTRAQ